MAEGGAPEADHAPPLARYDLDAGGFSALDRITEFAAALCQAPIALISLVEGEGHQFLTGTGFHADELMLDLSFCAEAMKADEIFLLPDILSSQGLSDNLHVTDGFPVRFFAGTPLRDRQGVRFGTLCVADAKPRADLSPLQRQGLTLLASQAALELETRRRDREDAGRATDAEAIAESNRLFRTLADTMPQMVWSTLPDGYHDYYNARWYEYTGVPEGSTDGEAWNGMFHPDDQERAWARWRHSLISGEPYEIEYRLRHRNGDYRWTLGRALPIRDDDGRITRWIGTCTEIHEQKLMMEEREIIAHELSHRIKNIFSVISGLIGLSARQNPAIRAVADDLRDRIMALGRAHDFVRPHSVDGQVEEEQGRLRGILGQIFAPYQDAQGSRIILTGENPAIDDRSATPLALLFHELATNAAKYGALSVPKGRVHIDVRLEDPDIRIEWREEGGPAVSPVFDEGFGSRLMQLSVERQLGGWIARDWRPEGLLISLSIPSRSMSRSFAKKA